MQSTEREADGTMADHGVPHFHNDPGVAVVVREANRVSAARPCTAQTTLARLGSTPLAKSFKHADSLSAAKPPACTIPAEAGGAGNRFASAA